MSEKQRDMDVQIRDDPESGAYLIEVDGERAGEAVYHKRGDRFMFIHTEVDERFSGMGLGTRLVRFALDDVRDRGGSVVPVCPFFASYIDRHPEYEDLVDEDVYQRVLKARRKASDVDD